MKFIILKSNKDLPSSLVNTCILYHNSWDDYGYQVTFNLVYYDKDAHKKKIGLVRIAEKELSSGVPSLPKEFKSLGSKFISLGDGLRYYEAIRELNTEIRNNILNSLNDISYNLKLLDDNIKKTVVEVSFLRSTSKFEVQNQFHRVALGGVSLTKYNFSVNLKNSENKIDFNVHPNSAPPTNIHAIIGSNGVGKTHFLSNLIKELTGQDSNPNFTLNKNENDYFTPENEIGEFANLISISFSAFDLNEIENINNSEIEIDYHNIRLNASNNDLLDQFSKSLKRCSDSQKNDLWAKTLKKLESDKIFNEYNIPDYKDLTSKEISSLKDIFEKLSSGHKIILLSLTKLIEALEEKSLILIDEPETHLHPPLLSTYVRTLSELLTEKNGVAILATHSPVILQEVPKKCIWKFSRSNKRLKAERPIIETFGENVGTLTHDVFGLEVSKSGFNKLISDIIQEKGLKSYSEVASIFEKEIGTEAKILIQSLINIENE